ncbi:MAG: hypothetical protein ABFR33_01400 [Verrucomicrobiota bacterium]
MSIDNTIVVNRDYEEVRASFLEALDDDKLKGEVNDLGSQPYFLPQIFPKTKGVGVRRLFKKKVALLQTIEPLLERMLFAGEEVRFASSGIYCNLAEQYFLGAFSSYINRTVFIFTNYRIILLNVGKNAKPLQMKWHIPYDQIKKFSTGGLSSSMVFKLKDKKRYTFSSMPSFDRKPAKAFVNEMIMRAQKEEFHMPSFECRDNLCPSCYTPIPKSIYACEKCGDKFIQPKKPTLMSLCLPCLGDFYMGHRALGVMELLGYSFMWVILAGRLIASGTSALPFVGFILLIEHGFDAILTNHMAKKGLVSVSKAWKAH